MSLATRKATAQQYSQIQPLWKFFFLSIVTFNTYQLAWGYKHWKLIIKRERPDLVVSLLGEDLTSFFDSLLLRFTLYELSQKIFALAKRKGYQKNPSPLMIAIFYFIFTSLANIDRCEFMSLLSCLPLSIVLNATNCYWQKEQPSLPIRKSLTASEIAWTAFGVVLWGLILIASIAPSANSV